MSVDFTFDQSELNQALDGASKIFDGAFKLEARGNAYAHAMLFAISEAGNPGSGRDTLDKLAVIAGAFDRMSKLDPAFLGAFGNNLTFKGLKQDEGMDLSLFLKSQVIFNEAYETLPTPSSEWISNKYERSGVDILSAMRSDKMELSYEVFSAKTHQRLPPGEMRQHSVYIERTPLEDDRSQFKYTVFDPNRGGLIARSMDEAAEFLDASLRRLNEPTISGASKDAYFPRYLRDLSAVPENVWNSLESVARHVQKFAMTDAITADGETQWVSADSTLTPHYTFSLKDNVLHFTAEVTFHRNGEPDETKSYTDDATFANWKQFDWKVKNDFNLPTPRDRRDIAFDPMIAAPGKLEQLVQALSASRDPDGGIDAITSSIVLRPGSVSLAMVR
ncbi:hypothetical protein ACPWR0_07630 [Pandoraea pneumonica]|uniref:hypothetical protein n=1 Tax=Pandoraea pneumonica TaxID=2508299 RepID=UPI003CFA9CC8